MAKGCIYYDKMYDLLKIFLLNQIENTIECF